MVKPTKTDQCKRKRDLELSEFMSGDEPRSKIAKAAAWKEAHPDDKRSAESIVKACKRKETVTTVTHGNSKLTDQQEDLYLCTVVGFSHLN